MFKLKERPPVAAIDYVSCLPSTYIETLEQKPDGLAVRAAVFRTIHGCPYVLILKRSETDSLPGRWELPGGEYPDRFPASTTYHQAHGLQVVSILRTRRSEMPLHVNSRKKLV